MDVEEFIARWSGATISERSHYQTFISQLCALIGVPAPDQERVGDPGYCFERQVRFEYDDGRSHSGYIDCYKRDCFVLEAKQSEKRGAGGDLDPAPHLARLAWLVRSIGGRTPVGDDGRVDPVAHSARASQTALFVMQCIFAMFADSVNLIEGRGFLRLLESYRGDAGRFHLGAEDFFRHMDVGGYCLAVRQNIRHFNGGLFKHAAAMPITEAELETLIVAAQRDWASVEPAIFGALLEQALDPAERLELGAHYTPKAYVRRLVEATVMELLHADWEVCRVGAFEAFVSGRVEEARKRIKAFHRQLCGVRVLDPACGTGNFLYVAMDMMKDLESEVLTALSDMGDTQTGLGLDGHTVSPGQFLGLEKNPSAAWIAEMVMWIGYLQWHFRTWRNAMPTEPILQRFHCIQPVDALIVSDHQALRRDDAGRPLTRVRTVRTDRRSEAQNSSRHEEREVVRLINPSPTVWPSADFIIGNPPFIGGKDLRAALGDGYVDALWQVRQGRFRSADLVTAWWDRAAGILTAKGSRLRRFGFITTNSITQTFSRRVLEHHLNGQPPMRLTFAIPDHPWMAGPGRADVRIAMTVAERGAPDGEGRLLTVVEERAGEGETPHIVFREQRGTIAPDLTVGLPGNGARALKANALLCSAGVKLHGGGFIVSEARAQALLAASDEDAETPIRPYRNGRDLAQHSRGEQVIDLFGWSEDEARRRHPAVFQHLLETVKPERDRNNRAAYRDNWWIFGEPRREFRPALEGLSRYIVTVETAKHRWFRFLDAGVTADNTLIAIASDDARVLGVLSSRPHVMWALARGGRLEDRPVYTKTACFDAYPFPDLSGWAGAEIGALAEEIDALRARVLGQNDELTMTGLYNARHRLMAGEDLSDAERSIHDAGCVGLLHHLHQRLDEMVLRAYGWAADMADAEVLDGLLRLNRARAEEEASGEVRFLRPDYQQARVRTSRRAVQIEAPLGPRPAPLSMPQGPEALAESLLEELRRKGGPMQPIDLARRFSNRPGRRIEDRIEQTLAILAVAGSVQQTDRGWFSPRRP